MPKILKLFRVEAVVSLRRTNSGPKQLLAGRPGRVAALVSLASLMFLSACSSSSSSSAGIKCVGATGSYTNASLGASGTQWTYSMSGWILDSTGAYSPYTQAGVFTVDGKGNITGGADDFYGGNVTGNYSIISNGTGTMNLNIATSAGNQPLVLGITLGNTGGTAQQSVGSFALIEADSFANASGVAYQQNSNTLTASPSGTFVFRNHVLTSGTSIAGSQSSVGLISFAANGTVTVNDDYDKFGVPGTSTGFSGTFTAPTGGIGSLTYSDGLGSQTFDYFVIDANDLILYETDATNGGLGLGRAELQQAPTGGFTNASFSGSFAFGSRGDTSSTGANGVNSVGQFATDGNGNITGGAWDYVRDGSPQLSLSLGASTYSLTSNGRVAGTLGSSTAAIYLVSPSRAFFLINSDATRVEDGTMDQQTTTSFSNSSFNGQYAFVMGGAASGTPLDRTGTVQADGNGNLGWAEQVNSGGSGNGVCLTGTYTASSNGRVLGSVSTLSNNLIIYLVSQNSGYALQGDSGAQLSGGILNQNQPNALIPGIF